MTPRPGVARWWLVVALGTFAHVLVAMPAANAEADSAPSVAEIARQRSEAKRIEGRFHEQVATIVGVPAGTIAGLLPNEKRISGLAARLIEVIERELRPLSDAEKDAVRRADDTRRAALANLRK